MKKMTTRLVIAKDLFALGLSLSLTASVGKANNTLGSLGATNETRLGDTVSRVATEQEDDAAWKVADSKGTFTSYAEFYTTHPLSRRIESMRAAVDWTGVIRQPNGSRIRIDMNDGYSLMHPLAIYGQAEVTIRGGKTRQEMVRVSDAIKWNLLATEAYSGSGGVLFRHQTPIDKAIVKYCLTGDTNSPAMYILDVQPERQGLPPGDVQPSSGQFRMNIIGFEIGPRASSMRDGKEILFLAQGQCLLSNGTIVTSYPVATVTASNVTLRGDAASLRYDFTSDTRFCSTNATFNAASLRIGDQVTILSTKQAPFIATKVRNGSPVFDEGKAELDPTQFK